MDPKSSISSQCKTIVDVHNHTSGSTRKNQITFCSIEESESIVTEELQKFKTLVCKNK